MTRNRDPGRHQIVDRKNARMSALGVGQLVLPASIGAAASQAGVAAIAWTLSRTLLLGALVLGHQSKSGDLVYEGSD